MSSPAAANGLICRAFHRGLRTGRRGGGLTWRANRKVAAMRVRAPAGAPRREGRQVPDQCSQGADVHRGQDDDGVRYTADSR